MQNAEDQEFFLKPWEVTEHEKQMAARKMSALFKASAVANDGWRYTALTGKLLFCRADSKPWIKVGRGKDGVVGALPVEEGLALILDDSKNEVLQAQLKRSDVALKLARWASRSPADRALAVLEKDHGSKVTIAQVREALANEPERPTKVPKGIAIEFTKPYVAVNVNAPATTCPKCDRAARTGVSMPSLRNFVGPYLELGRNVVSMEYLRYAAGFAPTGSADAVAPVAAMFADGVLTLGDDVDAPGTKAGVSETVSELKTKAPPRGNKAAREKTAPATEV